MKVYLVGGAVRDRLLNRPVEERDWVVVGETPDSMLQQGFKPVGKDFPVFLHPETKEEYALARTERKTSHGYTGFAVHTDVDVTLEQDLLRRDLTINAMAMTPEGDLIDPYNGKHDLEQRVFRHVSPAFSEDPVRLLRLARFAARYQPLGFTIAEETRQLLINMVKAGEVDYLVPERVWAEWFKALKEPTPSAFFYVLRDCGALARIFPEIEALFGVPQPAKYHPEIDTGIHSLMVLDQAAKLSNDTEVRFAALVHDLGKALSPKDNLPHHHGHEFAGLPVLEKLCQRLRVPRSYKILAMHVMEHHTRCHKAMELRAGTITDLLTFLGVHKPQHKFNEFLIACEADARGRIGFENRDYPQADLLRTAAKAIVAVDISPVLTRGLQGEMIGQEIRRLRIDAVLKAINTFKK